MKHVLVVDNDDSFVYNIVEMLRPLAIVDVVKHSSLGHYSHYDKILLSPGAGLPAEYPAMMQLLMRSAATHSILGICLGHQAVAQHFGASLIRLQKPLHGHEGRLSNPFLGVETVGRYHSWVVDEETLPADLDIISRDCDDGSIMALRHRTLPIYGVQFHPESIITNGGVKFFENWIDQ